MIKFNEDDIKEVMEITSLNKEKAIKLFKSVASDIDDGTDDEICSYDVLDVIKIEYKAKQSGASKIYAQSEKPKTKAKREIKLDDVKVDFLKNIKILLEGMALNGKIDNVAIVNPQKEITFTIGADCYSLNLVKHRPPKKKQVKLAEIKSASFYFCAILLLTIVAEGSIIARRRQAPAAEFYIIPQLSHFVKRKIEQILSWRNPEICVKLLFAFSPECAIL